MWYTKDLKMTKLIKEKKYRFEVPEGKKKERIDTFLTNSIENATRTKVQKSIEAELVKVNGKVVKANYKIKPHDIIEAIQPITPRPEDVEPENIPLDIVYEDEFLLVVNKPAGMVAHPAYANYTGTLLLLLIYVSIVPSFFSNLPQQIALYTRSAVCFENCSANFACTQSSFATTSNPLVPLSKR